MDAWSEPLLDAEQMRAVDRWAIQERGVPSLELMEAAGIALAERAVAVAIQRGAERIGVVCGSGNNGGDGLVAARHLHRRGFATEVAVLAPRERLSQDSAANADRMPAAVPVRFGAGPGEVEALASRSGVLIDAMLGTGFSGSPREPVASTIRILNAGNRAIVAADIASGVDASTGEVVQGLAVRADETVTFHAAKLGHFIAPGKAHTGQLTVAPIGIPEAGPEGLDPAAGRILPRVIDALPRRGAESTKFSSGQVVVIGGSRGLTGAPCLSAMAAIRSGAGYATVVVPDDLEPIFEQKLTEVMSVGCPGPSGHLGTESLETAVESCERASAVALGPGLGRQDQTLRFVLEIVGSIEAPLVLDADGLFAFNDSGLDLLADVRTHATVLTPHEGELGRLLGRPSSEVAAHRLSAAREVAVRTGTIVVLKGDDTIVTDGRRTAVNSVSAPALATAGTGDVLAGLMAALLARLDDPFHAASAAVYAHSRAGLFAAEKVGLAESVIASDVIAALPDGLRR